MSKSSLYFLFDFSGILLSVLMYIAVVFCFAGVYAGILYLLTCWLAPTLSISYGVCFLVMMTLMIMIGFVNAISKASGCFLDVFKRSDRRRRGAKG